jgi:hypothetical protein
MRISKVQFCVDAPLANDLLLCLDCFRVDTLVEERSSQKILK